MSPEFTLALALTLVAGLCQGTFGLGMRRFAPLAWEALWLIFSIVGMIVLPIATASLLVPDTFAAIAAAPRDALAKCAIFAFIWGVSSITFGLALNYLGVSLGYGIAVGLAAAVGSLIPLFQLTDVWSRPATPWILLGNAVMVAGVAVASWAGIARDGEMARSGKEVAGIQKGRLFWLGLAFCLFSAFGAAMLNVAFAAAQPIAEAAALQGAAPRNASLACWVAVFASGVIPNAGYALWLLLTKGTFRTYAAPGASRGYGWALFTAVLWFAALALYGQGAALMGELGTSLAWTMFLAISLIVSSAWGIGTGEWQGFRRPLRILLAGDAVLLLSWIVLGYANSL